MVVVIDVIVVSFGLTVSHYQKDFLSLTQQIHYNVKTHIMMILNQNNK
jgi:hypothetical protein